MREQEKVDLGAAVAMAVTERMEELRAELSQSVKSLRIKGALVRPVTEFKTSGVVSTSNGALVGYGLYETSGITGAKVMLRDGIDGGEIVVPIVLGPGESVRDFFGDAGLSFTTGLYFNVVSGAVDGAVYLSGAT